MQRREIVSVQNPNDGTPLAVEMENVASESGQQEIIAHLRALNSLLPTGYDQILFEYTGDDLTSSIFYANGEIIATIQMTYSEHRLTGVRKA